MFKTPVCICCENKRVYREVQNILFKNDFEWCNTGKGIWFPDQLINAEDNEKIAMYIYAGSDFKMYNSGSTDAKIIIFGKMFIAKYGDIQLEFDFEGVD